MERSHGHAAEVTVYYLKPMTAALEYLGCQPEFDQDRMELHFYVSRVAMSGMGYIEGDEEYRGTLKVMRRAELGLTGDIPLLAEPFMALPKTLEAVCLDCPREQEHDVDEAREFLRELDPDPIAISILDMMTDEQILAMAYGQGLGDEDYCPPDEDYAFQECQHVLQQAMDAAERFPITYESDANLWLCDGDVVFDPQAVGSARDRCTACRHPAAACACQPIEEYAF